MGGERLWQRAVNSAFCSPAAAPARSVYPFSLKSALFSSSFPCPCFCSSPGGEEEVGRARIAEQRRADKSRFSQSHVGLRVATVGGSVTQALQKQPPGHAEHRLLEEPALLRAPRLIPKKR